MVIPGSHRLTQLLPYRYIPDIQLVHYSYEIQFLQGDTHAEHMYILL